MCFGVFAWLKWRNIDCEIAPEFAKECVWHDTTSLLEDQTAVFGEQHRRIFGLKKKVDVVLTDSPLILSVIYDRHHTQYLHDMVLSEFCKCNNLNFFLIRSKKYNPKGRLQTEEEAQKIDNQIIEFLELHSIPFVNRPGTEEQTSVIGNLILQTLASDCRI